MTTNATRQARRFIRWCERRDGIVDLTEDGRVRATVNTAHPLGVGRMTPERFGRIFTALTPAIRELLLEARDVDGADTTVH